MTVENESRAGQFTSEAGGNSKRMPWVGSCRCLLSNKSNLAAGHRMIQRYFILVLFDEFEKLDCYWFFGTRVICLVKSVKPLHQIIISLACSFLQSVRIEEILDTEQVK